MIVRNTNLGNYPLFLLPIAQKVFKLWSWYFHISFKFFSRFFKISKKNNWRVKNQNFENWDPSCFKLAKISWSWDILNFFCPSPSQIFLKFFYLKSYFYLKRVHIFFDQNIFFFKKCFFAFLKFENIHCQNFIVLCAEMAEIFIKKRQNDKK